MASAPLSFIGFGEAGQAFAAGLARARAYDRLTDVAATRAGKLADYARLDVTGEESSADAVAGAALVLSLVTADQALAAAQAAAPAIGRGALYCDMNSVAPETKRAAARAIEAAGGAYLDVAVMAPVHPQRRAVPLLVSGPEAEQGAAALRTAGFTEVRVLAGPVGAASAVKMIRSVMVKGREALSAECALAAHAAGVEEEVIASLDASRQDRGWAERFDYNLDRMLVHGLRRAAEMEEVVKTLDGLGIDAEMSRGTVRRQRALGSIGEGAPVGLAAKVELVLGRQAQAA